MDARGNKVGISAEFCPPKEMLAFPIVDSGERDLPEIWNVPHPLIVQVLLTYKTVEEVYENLPDLLDVHSWAIALGRI